MNKRNVCLVVCATVPPSGREAPLHQPSPHRQREPHLTCSTNINVLFFLFKSLQYVKHIKCHKCIFIIMDLQGLFEQKFLLHLCGFPLGFPVSSSSQKSYSGWCKFRNSKLSIGVYVRVKGGLHGMIGHQLSVSHYLRHLTSSPDSERKMKQELE